MYLDMEFPHPVCYVFQCIRKIPQSPYDFRHFKFCCKACNDFIIIQFFLPFMKLIVGHCILVVYFILKNDLHVLHVIIELDIALW